RAAGLVLGFAAVGSAAVPGSPVREWLDTAVRGIVGMVAEEAPVAPPAPEREVTAGVSVAPHAGHVRIQLEGVSPEATLHARLTDAAQASVQVIGEAEGVRFRTGPGRIEVRQIGAVELLIELPASVQDA